MAFFSKALAIAAKKKGLKKAPRGKAAIKALVGVKSKASPVRKKTAKKAPRRGGGMMGGASASPVRRRRKPTTGGGVTGGPRSPRTRKKAGTGGGGGSSVRSRFASIGPKQKRAAARQIARRRGR